MRRMTIESLLEARARQKEDDKTTYKDIEVKSLDMVIRVKKQKAIDVLEVMENISSDPTMKEAIQSSIDIIYMHVPIFKTKEIQEAYDCKIPSDIVLEIFNQNIEEVNKVAEGILSLYGFSLNEEVEEDIKK